MASHELAARSAISSVRSETRSPAQFAERGARGQSSCAASLDAAGARRTSSIGSPPDEAATSAPSSPHSVLLPSAAHFFPSPRLSTARNASCGTSTAPTCFIRFLPSFCFSSSFRLREMSPP